MVSVGSRVQSGRRELVTRVLSVSFHCQSIVAVSVGGGARLIDAKQRKPTLPDAASA